MSNIEDTVKKVIAGGIGAVATVVEKGSEMAKEFVNKGEETIRENQGTIDSVKEKVRNAFSGFDIKGMTREERDELRKMLDEADAEDDALDADAEEIAEDVNETAETVKKAAEEIGETAGNAAEKLGKMAEQAADVLNDAAGKLDDVMGKISDAFAGLFDDNKKDPE